MRTHLRLAVVAALAFSYAARGEQVSASAGEQATFRVTTRLVEFTLVALDRKGNPVTDLRPEEVSLYDRGKRREIAVFRYEGAADSASAPLPLPPLAFSNRAEFSPGPPRNITALVLDSLNTAPSDQIWVRATLMRFLRELAPENRLAVYHLGRRFTVLHDFTQDAFALRQRIEKSSLALAPRDLVNVADDIREAERLLELFDYDPAVQEMLTAQIEMQMQYNDLVRQERALATLAALDALGARLAGIPGRKSIVWIGGGISVLSVTGSMGFGPRGGVRSLEDQVRRVAERLAQRGVILYPVDARGLTPPEGFASDTVLSQPARPSGRGVWARQQQAEQISNDPLPASFLMAEVTGGRVLMNSNDPSQGLKAAAAELRGSYTVGFYIEGEPDGKWRELRVRVRRRGVQVRHRKGYLAERAAPAPLEWTPEQWRAAMENPLAPTAVRLDARLLPERPDAPARVALFVDIEPQDIMLTADGSGLVGEAEIGVAAKNEAGVLSLQTECMRLRMDAVTRQSAAPLRFRYARLLQLDPETTLVRVVVLDRRTGLNGALDLPLSQLKRQHVP